MKLSTGLAALLVLLPAITNAFVIPNVAEKRATHVAPRSSHIVARGTAPVTNPVKARGVSKSSKRKLAARQGGGDNFRGGFNGGFNGDGQGGNGQNNNGQNNNDQNNNGQDQGNQDQNGQDQNNQDQNGQDQNNQDQNNQDQNNQDQNGQDQNGQDQNNQDQNNQDQNNQDQNNQDQNGQDQNNQDQNGQDQGQQGQDGQQDQNGQDGQNQDGQNQDNQNQDGQNQDNQNQDGQNQDGQNQDGQNQDGQNQDGQNQDGQNQDGQNQDGQDGQNQDGQDQGQNGDNNNNGENNNGDNGNVDPQTSLTLLQELVAPGLAQDGQDPPVAGQVPSLTSTNNFIDFCVGQEITNGEQKVQGSCNPIPQGDIVGRERMPAGKFVFPTNFGTVAAGQPFTVQLAVQNMQTGFFTNAQKSYYAAPQQVNGDGILIAHSHVVIQRMGAFDSPDIIDATQFAFFKGLNAPAQNGILTADVTEGLEPGNYRMASIHTSANHVPAIVAVAQHGLLDDITYFTVQ